MEIGNKVKVIRKPYGCMACSREDCFIGQIGEIKGFSGMRKKVEVHKFPNTDSWCSGFTRDCLELVKEAKVDIRERIEGLNENTTLKELDDLLQEMEGDKSFSYPVLEIGFRSSQDFGGGAIRVKDNGCKEGQYIAETPYESQCKKLRALIDTLLQFAEKCGKLKNNKKEIAELRKQMEEIEKKIEKLEG